MIAFAMHRTGRDRFAIFILFAIMLSGGGCTKEMRESRLVSQAGRDFEAGAYDKAEVEYLKARLLVPHDPAVILQLGIIYYNEGRFFEAYNFLKGATELDPHSTVVQLKFGEASYSLGDAKAARDAAKQVLQVEPSNEEALLLLCDTSRLPPQEDETIRIVNQLSQTHPDCAGYHVVLGRLKFGHRDADGAEKEARSALELDPKSSAANELLGSIYQLRGDVKQAAEAYRTAANLAPLRSLRRLVDIDFRMRTGDPAEAKKDLETLINRAPDYIPALVDGMKVAFRDKRFTDCQQLLDRIFMREPRNQDALVDQGALYTTQGDRAAAVTALEKAEGVYPRSATIKLQLALAYVGIGEMTKSEGRLVQALSLDPSFDQASMVLAELDLRKGDPVAAIGLLDPLTQSHIRLGPAYLLLARAYAMHREPDQALAVYRKLAAVFPKDPQVPYLMGLVLAGQDRRADARQAFEIALEIDPGYGPAMDMVVYSDLADQHIDAAAARVEAFIQKYPKSARPWLLRAEIDRVRSDVAAGESDLLKAIDLDPRAQPAYIKLAQLYFSTHQSAKAIERLTAFVAKTKNVTAEMEIAAIHESLAQFDSAAADYREVLGFDPNFGPALNDLAFLYSEHLGKIDEAYELAKQAREISPDDSDTADTLGWILYRRGDARGALELVQECAQKSPENAVAQFHLGMIHSRLGEEGPGREAFERALAGPAGGQLDAESAGAARQELAVMAIDPAAAPRAALDELENREKADPDDPIVLARLGILQAKFGESKQAAKTLAADLKITPRNVEAMLALAQVYSGPLPDPDQARILAKSVHEIEPDNPRVSEILGNLLYQTGDYVWSEDLLQEAARAKPGQPTLQYELALSQYAIGRGSEAGVNLNRMLSGGPEFAKRDEALQLAAMIAAGASPEKAEAAADDARRILEKNPGSLPAMMVSALALERQDGSAAAAAYEKILAKDPYLTPATRQLAVILARSSGNTQKAYDLAIQAHEAFPDDPGVAAALGIMDYRIGNYDAAVTLLQESLKKRADDGEALSYLGLSHLGLKQTKVAREELQRSLELKLPAEQADRVKRVLDDAK
jgi:tetratricopeptide (TPR) repeat protein